jgi:hypothetical protein
MLTKKILKKKKKLNNLNKRNTPEVELNTFSVSRDEKGEMN